MNEKQHKEHDAHKQITIESAVCALINILRSKFPDFSYTYPLEMNKERLRLAQVVYGKDSQHYKNYSEELEWAEGLYKRRKELDSLGDDVLDAIDYRHAKKVETKTILSYEEFDNLKKRIRKEIAEECKNDINIELSDLIGETSISWRNEFEKFHKDSTERILKIIRGDW